MQCTSEYILIGRCQADVGGSHSAPSTGNRQKHFGLLFNKRCLLFRRQHQVAITLLLVGERSENSAPDPEVGRAHVRTFLRAIQLQRNTSKIGKVHRDSSSTNQG